MAMFAVVGVGIRTTKSPTVMVGLLEVVVGLGAYRIYIAPLVVKLPEGFLQNLSELVFRC